jgi:four helix bundle protein
MTDAEVYRTVLPLMFAHEKLQVYCKALAFTANVMTLVSGWDKKHALVDQFGRAAESVVLNLAEAARLKDAPARLNVSDYAIGSALECAGCLDVARIKGRVLFANLRIRRRLVVGRPNVRVFWYRNDAAVLVPVNEFRPAHAAGQNGYDEDKSRADSDARHDISPLLPEPSIRTGVRTMSLAAMNLMSKEK